MYNVLIYSSVAGFITTTLSTSHVSVISGSLFLCYSSNDSLKRWISKYISLTDGCLWDVAVICKVWFSNSSYRIVAWALTVNCSQVSVTESHWWKVNIGSGDGLVPSDTAAWSHCLSHCWPRSMSSRSQWVKHTGAGRNFEDNICKCIFLKENVCILIEISLKFFPKIIIKTCRYWLM